MTHSINPPYKNGRWSSVFCKLSLTGGALVPVVMAGCAMCCGTRDYEYPMFQGRYSRTDPEHGRVGSLFSDPNVGPGVPPLTNADLPVEDRNNRIQDPELDVPVDPDFEIAPPLRDDPENAQPVEQDTAVRYRNPPHR